MFKRHPVDNPRITYGFGAGGDKWGANKHLGVDYGDDVGTPIYAPASGFVVWARGSAAAAGNPWEQIPNSGNNGNCIIINHGPDDWATHTLYAHLSGFNVTEGQWVNAGDLIGYMGNTGYSFGSHLHWEMFIDYSEGQYPAGTFYGRVDPLDYFDVVTNVPVAPGSAGGSSTSTPPPAKPKEWDEMASKNEIKAAYREVLKEPAVLDALALAVLKRDCFLVDPSGKSGKITGTTTLATKVNWMAHNDAQLLNVLVAIGEKLGLKLDELIELHEEDAGESVPELLAPDANETETP